MRISDRRAQSVGAKAIPTDEHSHRTTASTGQRPGSQWLRIAVVACLIAIATVLHYGIDVQAGAVHDVLLRSYYLPIVLAGLWFGAPGGLITAAVVSVVFFPHAMHGWHAPYTFVFRLIEMLMYHVIGGLTGWMSSRANSALAAEKAARLQRENAYDDLKNQTQMLFEMEEQLRRSERLAALGRMSAGLAHEIRNPLSSIKTSAEMLEEHARQRESASAREIELLEVLSEETNRLNRILTEFLRFARVEVQQEEHGPVECDVADVLSSTISFLELDLLDKHIEVAFDAPSLDRRAAISEDHLRQVLLNLILNSTDAMPSGGEIAIALADETPDEITLSIEDSGHGIPESASNSVFDPFYSTKQGGVGLGLSIVARLVEACGGRVTLDHEFSSGARFLVTLPKSSRR